MAYDKDYGHSVRKSYKFYAKRRYQDHGQDTSNTDLFDYKMTKKCKYCYVERESIVYMFDHIREKEIHCGTGSRRITTIFHIVKY